MWVGGRRRRRRRHRVPPPRRDSGPPSNSCDLGDDDSAQTMSTATTETTRTHKTTKTKTTTTSSTWTCNRRPIGRKYCTLLASSALFALITQTMAGSGGMLLPAWRRQHTAPAGMARNIRHLPCVSRRTGETGLCMFAYSCAKANGTHLGTCIDRFYFGSCCKISPNSDPDLTEPLSSNHLNREDASSSTKRPTFLPDYSAISSTYPSTSGLPSSLAELFTSSTTFVKTTSSGSATSTRPASVHTISSLSFDTVPITSRTPLVNVTLSQSYSTPLSHVTTSPLVYSTTVSTVFQGSTHRPAGVSSSTASHSKPVAKPTSKPNKPKPTGPGKPGPTKPKPTKLPAKPSTTASVATFPNRNTTFSTPSGLSSSSSSSSSSSNYRPTYVIDTTVPTRLPSRPSTQSVPTPITLFTSSKRPTKPTKVPSTVVYTTTTSAPPTSFVQIQVSTVGHSKPTTALPSTTDGSGHHSSSTTDNFYSRVNFTSSGGGSTTISMGTERPLKPWQTPTAASWSSTAVTTAASISSSSNSSSSSNYVPSPSSTASQPSLVTWTTIDEVPPIIIPDRTKPTSIVRPSGKPPVTKPTFFPTFPKPISSTERPTSRPDLFKPTTKPEFEYSTKPSATTTTTTSSSWIELTLATHAPAVSVPSTTSETSEVTVSMIMQSTAKPSTSITIPVSSPLPVQTTSSPSPTGQNEILNVSDYREVCGRRLFPTGRIVGGEKATFGKWPWQISLRQWRTSTYLHKCGAALFNENWAVTAAHCVENVSPSDLLLRLGEHDLAVEDEPFGYLERRVPFVASHPKFDPRTFEYDLALLRFDEPVKFQPNIIPVCVPEDDTNFVGSEAFVTGWGRLYEDGPLPSVLQEVSVPVINNSVCENMYQAAGYIEHIPNIFICAGWKKGGFDSCEGDSGGPMVIQRPDNRWLLAGIISWGIGCAEPNQPGVYTRISEFRDWINQILQMSEWWSIGKPINFPA